MSEIASLCVQIQNSHSSLHYIRTATEDVETGDRCPAVTAAGWDEWGEGEW